MLARCSAHEPSDVCPTVAASLCNGSLSPEGYQVDSRHTGNQQSDNVKPHACNTQVDNGVFHRHKERSSSLSTDWYII